MRFWNRSKKRKTLCRIMAMVFLSCLCLAGCAEEDGAEEISEKYSVSEDRELIVYTSHKENVYLPIIREFEDRTGIWVRLRSGGTEEMLQEAKKASEAGECDVMFGGGVESYEANRELFLPYASKEEGSLNPLYQSGEHAWTPFTELPIVLIYNSTLVSKEDAPKGWEDLFDPKWKGQIAFADPYRSGTSYTIFSTMQQVFGEEPEVLLRRFIAQLDGRLLSGSGDVKTRVEDGSFLVGITLEETALRAVREGEDLAMLYPVEGTSAVADGCAVVKNAPHVRNAEQFIDFVAGKDTQEYCTRQLLRRPVRTDIALSDSFEEIRLVPFDIEASAAGEKEFLDLWSILWQEGD